MRWCACGEGAKTRNHCLFWEIGNAYDQSVVLVIALSMMDGRECRFHLSRYL